MSPGGPTSSLGSEWPIRNALLFKWSFEKSENLEEITDKIEGYHFYIRVKEDLIVTTNSENPEVIFVLKQENEEGGFLLIIQTKEGRYSTEKIKDEGTSIYGEKLGIRVKPSKIIPDETG